MYIFQGFQCQQNGVNCQQVYEINWHSHLNSLMIHHQPREHLVAQYQTITPNYIHLCDHKIPMESEIPQIVQLIKQRQPYLIGISGIPGSGKSTLSSLLSLHLPHSQVVPMDGYHLYRTQLNQHGHQHRGAAFTFDNQKFKSDILSLKVKRQGHFPEFDHKYKDPVQNMISVSSENKVVIVEGLYVFVEDWELEEAWDMKIWVQCEEDVAMSRVAVRHLECGIEGTREEAEARANRNDRNNAKYVLKSSNLHNTIKLHNTKQEPSIKS